MSTKTVWIVTIESTWSTPDGTKHTKRSTVESYRDPLKFYRTLRKDQDHVVLFAVALEVQEDDGVTA